MYKRWDLDSIKKEALKYKNRGDFFKKSRGVYDAARKYDVLDIVCVHMCHGNEKWTNDKIKERSLLYKTRNEFCNKDASVYNAARRLGILDEVCQHMDCVYEEWDLNKIKERSLLYKTRGEFVKKDSKAYDAARKYDILDEVCKHMLPVLEKWTNNKIKERSLLYKTRGEFENKDSRAYAAARRLGILDEVCRYAYKEPYISYPEKELLSEVQKFYPKAQKLIDRKVSIEDKTHIKGFEIDIYIPELRKGIEFDGKYYHSIEGLKRARPHWSPEDLENYHYIKDCYFKSKNIKIFHIKEDDWLENRNYCVKQCMEFLSGN